MRKLASIVIVILGCGNVSQKPSDAGPGAEAGSDIDAATTDSGSDPDSPPPDAAPGMFTITAAPEVQVVQGSSVMLAVTIDRGAGFTDPVQVTLANLPNGVTATPLTVDATMTSGMVAVQANNNATQGGPVAFDVNGVSTVGSQTAMASSRVTVRGTPGSPDLSWDLDGLATLDFGAQVIAAQNDGAVLVAGALNGDVAVRRFTNTGANDNTFGTNGLVTFPIGSANDVAFAMLIDPDGKIVISGSFVDANNLTNTFVARLNPNGALDTTFGNGGRFIRDVVAGASDFSRAVLRRADGKILSFGVASFNDLVVIRLDANGVPDPTFGANGQVQMAIGPNLGLNGATFDADGKIVLVGIQKSPNSPAGTQFPSGIVMRLLATGDTFDGTFGSGGKALFENFRVTPGSTIFIALTLQSDGRIVVVGRTDGDTSGFNQDGLVLRVLGDGARDPQFGGGTGVVFGPTSTVLDSLVAVSQLGNGALLTVGSTTDFASGNPGTAFTRHNLANGTFDTAYGQKNVPIARTNPIAAFTRDGRVLVGTAGVADPIARIWE
jgi:uncharacterized delta-60 repeat protein